MTDNAGQHDEGIGKIEIAYTKEIATVIKISLVGAAVGLAVAALAVTKNPDIGKGLAGLFSNSEAPSKDAVILANSVVAGTIAGGITSGASAIGWAVNGLRKGDAATKQCGELVTQNEKLIEQNKNLTRYVVSAINHQGVAVQSEQGVQLAG